MLPLAPDYYRRNFRFLIDFVQRYRGHLIDAELADFLGRFEGLTPQRYGVSLGQTALRGDR